MPDDAEQLSLGPIETAFAASGLPELPHGVGDLTKRERLFVLGMLEHGQQTRAAVDAGYSADSAASIASETLKKPKVFAFYRRCLKSVSDNADQIVRRTYERSVLFHAKLMECAQVKAEMLAEWELAKERHEAGKNAKDVKEFERVRERVMREEKHYASLANQTDTLLGTLLGKIKMDIDNSTTINVVTPEDRQHLVELQQMGVYLPAAPALRGGRN